MIRIERHRLFAKERIAINGYSDLHLTAGRGFAVVTQGKSSLANVRNFKEIWLGDEQLGIRRYPPLPFSGETFYVSTMQGNYHMRFESVLSFLGEKSYRIYRNEECVCGIRSMQNIGFMGGHVVSEDYNEKDFGPVLALTVYWWMEKNFLADNSPTGS